MKTATFGRKECDSMARPSLAEKDILNPFEAIDYFVLSRRKFYDLLKNTDLDLLVNIVDVSVFEGLV